MKDLKYGRTGSCITHKSLLYQNCHINSRKGGVLQHMNLWRKKGKRAAFSDIVAFMERQALIFARPNFW